MTEAEWLASTDPVEMLTAIRFGEPNPRKFALFGCATGRQIWDFLDEEQRERIVATEQNEAVLEDPLEDRVIFERDLLRREVGVYCLSGLQRHGIQFQTSYLVREIFGNPFHPVATNPSWLTSDVVALATGIYQDAAFDRLPILADALEDAGCDSADLLTHLRGSGPHVRGCWVIDLVLGKS